ncbi:hypothetical protein B0H69_004756 [Clostridium beijerinckii]|nr:hypothetical protein [Clostridium beijerinckii]NRT23420.1 hypothetical protein [Clostridium beijerinckii]NRT69008.1 hypothetical protein [Clostridium beijerinckii]NRT80698.1 hypothetical protein [Clostridium beijerinckii]NRT84840.1 hypothetical protein [Clostridium beijerinckii]
MESSISMFGYSKNDIAGSCEFVSYGSNDESIWGSKI